MEFSFTIWLGFFSTLFYSLVQVVIKLWLLKLKLVNTIWDKIFVSVPYAVLCGVLGLSGFILWAFALQKAGIAQIYWVTASAYIIIPVMGFLFFKEQLTINAIVGYGLITMGAILASNTK